MEKTHKEDKISLDIGCGERKTQNSIGVDIMKTKGADVIGDLQHLSFKNQSVNKILCYQLLEHIDDLIKAMEEIHRVLKKKEGGE